MLPHIINFLAILATAYSLPASLPDILPRQTYGGDGYCNNGYRYSVTSDTTAWSPVTVADGEACTSNAVEPCTVGQSFTKSFSITQEVGASVDLCVLAIVPEVSRFSFPSFLLSY